MTTLWDEEADEVEKSINCVLNCGGEQIALKKSAIG